MYYIMGRFIIKTDTLSLDDIKAIKELTDHNIGKFWLERLGPKEMSQSTFYQIMAGAPAAPYHLKAIEDALLACDLDGEFLNGDNRALRELERFFRRWWPKYSEEVGYDDRPSELHTRSGKMSPVRDMLVALKIVDARGFLYDPTTNPRPEA